MDDDHSHARGQLGGHGSILDNLDLREGSEDPAPTFGSDLPEEAEVRDGDASARGPTPVRARRDVRAEGDRSRHPAQRRAESPKASGCDEVGLDRRVQREPCREVDDRMDACAGLVEIVEVVRSMDPDAQTAQALSGPERRNGEKRNDDDDGTRQTRGSHAAPPVSRLRYFKIRAGQSVGTTEPPVWREHDTYHRIAALAHVKPDPNAVRTSRSPRASRPSSRASCSAIGIDAAVVLPYFWMFTYT